MHKSLSATAEIESKLATKPITIEEFCNLAPIESPKQRGPYKTKKQKETQKQGCNSSLFYYFCLMYRLSILLIFIYLFSCNKKADYSYYNYYWAGKVKDRNDTVFFHQKITVRNDSFILDNEWRYTPPATPPPPDIFIFNLKDKTKVFHNQTNGTRMFEYLNDTIIRMPKHNYHVFKYLEDEEGAFDAAGNFFWCPDFGIIYIRGLQGSHRLYTNNQQLDSIIGNIIDAIREF